MPVDLNTSIPHSARIYDFLLGGKDNFDADRKAAAEIVERLVPGSALAISTVTACRDRTLTAGPRGRNQATKTQKMWPSGSA
jgi:hypothetical protein